MSVQNIYVEMTVEGKPHRIEMRVLPNGNIRSFRVLLQDHRGTWDIEIEQRAYSWAVVDMITKLAHLEETVSRER